MVTTIDSLLAKAVDNGVAAGFHAMATHHGEIVYSGGAGTRDGTAPWTEDTIAWLASMTKPIVAVAALQLVERGLIGLDTPTADVLPELAAAQVLEGYDGDVPRLRPARTPVTLRMLLSHTAGAGYAFLSADLARYQRENGIPTSLECKQASIVDSPLVYEPGTDTRYGTGLEWVGLAISRLTGRDLATHLREAVFDPAGMTDTAFGIVDRSRLATMQAGPVTVPFELPAEPEFFSGGGGLYGTPRDYLKFLRTLGDTTDGVRLLSPATLTAARRSQSAVFGRLTSANPATSHDIDLLPGTPVSWSLLGMRNEERTPQGRPIGTVAWAGGANCYFWADPDGATAGVLFTQLVPFADPEVIALFAGIEEAVRA
ncbi:serine hydrolase domain-containing protein [Amycolatopsis tolypomycina]|uniref:CubicO group peptidase, beta-lactamase class C family n=1 Tax=Amycolatopsis tolypomycina TaxID=208445 RepID=A0A1H4VKP5_9PSEU|nr:serine hydrolase domain-containing protein [Amycolatopsis tolypomycina]SEC81576.1 CubicO group peptidase, beta-lactamase class C family [Amycolatopsis tolypomycina]